jgi:hypothetical protein
LEEKEEEAEETAEADMLSKGQLISLLDMSFPLPP